MRNHTGEGDPGAADHNTRVDRCLSMIMHHEEVEQIASIVKEILRESSCPERERGQ